MSKSRRGNTLQHLAHWAKKSDLSAGRLTHHNFTSLQVVLLLSLPCQSWKHFFLSCLVTLRYYKNPSFSNIWEQILKHHRFSQWVSSFGVTWWKVLLLSSCRQRQHWPAWSQRGRVTSCQAGNANAMTGEPSGPLFSHQVQGGSGSVFG